MTSNAWHESHRAPWNTGVERTVRPLGVGVVIALIYREQALAQESDETTFATLELIQASAGSALAIALAALLLYALLRFLSACRADNTCAKSVRAWRCSLKRQGDSAKETAAEQPPSEAKPELEAAQRNGKSKELEAEQSPSELPTEEERLSPRLQARADVVHFGSKWLPVPVTKVNSARRHTNRAFRNLAIQWSPSRPW